jgi:hypothetical protein
MEFITARAAITEYLNQPEPPEPDAAGQLRSVIQSHREYLINLCDQIQILESALQDQRNWKKRKKPRLASPRLNRRTRLGG